MRRSTMMVAGRMTSFQSCVDACNTLPTGKLVPLEVAGIQAGEMVEATAEMLAVYSDVFVFSGRALTLTEALERGSPAERTEAISTVAASLRDAGVVTGWRNELVTVAAHFGEPPLFEMERAAYPLLGIAGYGAHVNGFVRDPSAPGGIKLWVATRSKAKQTWPGMRDHIVAGQISEGLSPTATVVKECEEEAGIPQDLAACAKPAGAVSYKGMDEEGRLKQDVLFVYDLELPHDFEPVAVDGEVESFELWTLDRVVALLEGTHDGEPYKPNVALVVIDFLLRQGFISPDEPGYLPLLASLRSGSFS